LDLAVEAWDSAERVVSARQRFDQGGVGLARSGHTSGGRCRRAEAVALRVVSETALPGPREDVGFGEHARVIASRGPEEVVELDDVLMTRRRVAVAMCELVDEDRERGWCVP
jgi:hypothetical protein